MKGEPSWTIISIKYIVISWQAQPTCFTFPSIFRKFLFLEDDFNHNIQSFKSVNFIYWQKEQSPSPNQRQQLKSLHIRHGQSPSDQFNKKLIDCIWEIIHICTLITDTQTNSLDLIVKWWNQQSKRQAHGLTDRWMDRHCSFSPTRQ